MIIDYTPQHIDGVTNPEWMALRLGKPSASKASSILTSTGKVSKQREVYLYTLAGQIVSGRSEDTFQSSSMVRGIENEDTSRKYFELMHDCEITQVGCCFPDEQRKYLCSPDGLWLEAEEGFETKDRCFKVQIEMLKKNAPEPDHFCQCQMSMLVTGYKAWWYINYCDGLPTLELKIDRDEKYIDELRIQLNLFCEELEELVKWLKSI